MALREALNRIRSNPHPLDEVKVLAWIILPILEHLGWDTADPNGTLSIHQEQPLKKGWFRIAFQRSDGIGVLTNGLEWRLYLLPATGESQDKGFVTIMVEKDPIEKVTSDLETFLSQKNIISGQSRKKLIDILKVKRQAILLANELPIIWQSMLSKPDNKLIDLIVERTYEKLELYPLKPQIVTILKPQVVKILESTCLKLENTKSDNSRTAPVSPPHSNQPPEPFMKPTKIRLFGVFHNVRSWTDFLIKVAEALYKRHTYTFDQILTLHPGRHLPYASRDGKALREPRLISSSKIYLETNLNSESIRERADLFLKHFGYDPPEDYLNILYD